MSCFLVYGGRNQKPLEMAKPECLLPIWTRQGERASQPASHSLSQAASQPVRERGRETNGPLNVRQSWGGERDFLFFLISHGRMVSICREGGRQGTRLRMTPLSLIISHMSLLSRTYFTWIFSPLCPVPHWPLINLTIISQYLSVFPSLSIDRQYLTGVYLYNLSYLTLLSHASH